MALTRKRLKKVPQKPPNTIENLRPKAPAPTAV